LAAFLRARRSFSARMRRLRSRFASLARRRASACRRAAEARPRAELDTDLRVAEFRADVEAEFQVLPGHLSSGSAALLLSNDLLRSNLCGVVRAQVDERFQMVAY